jgi:hypothetical protein
MPDALPLIRLNDVRLEVFHFSATHQQWMEPGGALDDKMNGLESGMEALSGFMPCVRPLHSQFLLRSSLLCSFA